jgi:outer membrane lipoprotein-sorting protein
MKKIATVGFSALLVLAIVAVSGSYSAANAQGSAGLISSILNKMEANRQSLRTLRASITVDRYDATIKDWDGKRSGTFMYIPAAGRSANVRIDWTSRPQETFSLVDGKYMLYQPANKTVFVGTKNSNKNTPDSVFRLLSMSSSQAKANYNLELLRDGGPDTHLKITPKSGGDFQFAEIWVDGNGMVVQAKVTSRNNDAQFIQLTNVQKNASISVDQLKIALPPGVTKVNT